MSVCMLCFVMQCMCAFMYVWYVLSMFVQCVSVSVWMYVCLYVCMVLRVCVYVRMCVFSVCMYLCMVYYVEYVFMDGMCVRMICKRVNMFVCSACMCVMKYMYVCTVCSYDLLCYVMCVCMRVCNVRV